MRSKADINRVMIQTGCALFLSMLPSPWGRFWVKSWCSPSTRCRSF